MGKGNIDNETNNSMGNNPILISLDCWTKYIEGFIKGLESCDKVNTGSVLDCIGEILEYICSFKPTLIKLLQHCEIILEENDKLKAELDKYKEQEKINGEDL